MAKRQDAINYYDKIDLSNPDILNRQPYTHRRTPIIATIGDPNITPVDIQKMMEAGMNVIRFKGTHCTVGEKIRLLGKVDKAAAFLCKKYAVLDWPIATCMELKTCIVRTGLLEGDEDIIIKEGNHVLLTYDLEEFDKCTAKKIFVDNPYIADDVKVGMTVSIEGDSILMRCTKIVDDKTIKCIVTKTGKLANLSLVFVRGEKTAKPLITRKDLQIIKFALEHQVDMILINYVRRVETLRKVKEFIGTNIRRPILLGGLCSLEGLSNIDSLLKESDGIVLSREFLAYEMEESARHRLLLIQKWIGAKCLQAGKPFFISGEVFKGALSRGEFYYNESADVTNALLDGATGFILRDSPNIDNVLDVIKALNSLCCTVEPLTNTKVDFRRILEGMHRPTNAAEACAISCVALAHQCNSRVIIVPTVTGQTIKMLMWMRPACLVLTVSSRQATTRRLNSYRCVVPLMYKDDGTHKNWESAMDARVRFALEYAVKVGWLNYGLCYVTLQRGTEKSAFCDTVRMGTVTIYKKSMVQCVEDEPQTSSSINSTLLI